MYIFYQRCISRIYLSADTQTGTCSWSTEFVSEIIVFNFELIEWCASRVQADEALLLLLLLLLWLSFIVAS